MQMCLAVAGSKDLQDVRLYFQQLADGCAVQEPLIADEWDAPLHSALNLGASFSSLNLLVELLSITDNEVLGLDLEQVAKALCSQSADDALELPACCSTKTCMWKLCVDLGVRPAVRVEEG